MPANLTNQPVTRHMNEKFLEDPNHPEGMPYSTSQIQSHIAAASVLYMYHPDFPKGRIVNKAEVEPLLKQGWTEEAITPENLAKAKTIPPKSELELLREECVKRGIPYDKRMGHASLRELIDAHERMST